MNTLMSSFDLDAKQGVYPNKGEWRRLAHRAAQHGMTLKIVTQRDRVDHFVHDPRDNSLHYVTGYSCDCRQFVGSGGAGCQHLALALVNRDWIPEAVTVAELAVAS